jgi:hypothetical protein
MANPAIDWTKVLTHPLGLVGYVLSLLFGLLARVKRRDERRWILPAALLAAGIALAGGLGLAYRSVGNQSQVTTPTPPPLQQHNENVEQRSSGANSPNVQGVQQGDVNISYGTHTPPSEQKSRKQDKGAAQQKAEAPQAQ